MDKKPISREGFDSLLKELKDLKDLESLKKIYIIGNLKIKKVNKQVIK